MKCEFKKRENSDLCECIHCGRTTKSCTAKAVCKNTKISNPSLLRRVINFAAAAGKHAIAGNPIVTEEVLQQRLELCKSCPLFKPNQNEVGGVCTHESCGCNIQDNLNYLNKIAWADQKCPIDRWGPMTPPSSGV